MRDAFDATNRINRILALVQKINNTCFFSLDMISLFTNISLRKSFNILLKRVYIEKLINTSLSGCSLKKLIPDTCQKTVLSFNDNLYEQIDGVSMG